MPRDALRCNMVDGKTVTRIAAAIPVVLVAAGWVLLGQAASAAAKDVLVGEAIRRDRVVGRSRDRHHAIVQKN